jgi:hypothetical protein
MNKKNVILTLILSAAMLISPLAGLVVATNPYTDPTAQSFNVVKSFSFANIMQGNHTYTPADNVANPVQKLVISYDETLLTCDIKVGGVTYSLGKDFTYVGHQELTYYNPSFSNPQFGYLFPSSSSSEEVKVDLMFNFSAIAGGIEGTIKITVTGKDGAVSARSLEGTGDFKNVDIQAAATNSFDAVNRVLTAYFDGMVSGWPHAVPAFHTTNIIVTYVTK